MPARPASDFHLNDDCILYIVEFLAHDFVALANLLRVSKQWFRAVVPILYARPLAPLNRCLQGHNASFIKSFHATLEVLELDSQCTRNSTTFIGGVLVDDMQSLGIEFSRLKRLKLSGPWFKTFMGALFRISPRLESAHFESYLLSFEEFDQDTMLPFMPPAQHTPELVPALAPSTPEAFATWRANGQGFKTTKDSTRISKSCIFAGYGFA